MKTHIKIFYFIMMCKMYSGTNEWQKYYNAFEEFVDEVDFTEYSENIELARDMVAQYSNKKKFRDRFKCWVLGIM